MVCELYFNKAAKKLQNKVKEGGLPPLPRPPTNEYLAYFHKGSCASKR